MAMSWRLGVVAQPSLTCGSIGLVETTILYSANNNPRSDGVSQPPDLDNKRHVMDWFRQQDHRIGHVTSVSST